MLVCQGNQDCSLRLLHKSKLCDFHKPLHLHHSSCTCTTHPALAHCSHYSHIHYPPLRAFKVHSHTTHINHLTPTPHRLLTPAPFLLHSHLSPCTFMYHSLLTHHYPPCTHTLPAQLSPCTHSHYSSSTHKPLTLHYDTHPALLHHSPFTGAPSPCKNTPLTLY